MQIRRTRKPGLETNSKKGQAKWQPTSVDDRIGQNGKEHWSRLRALRVIKTQGPVAHTLVNRRLRIAAEVCNIERLALPH